MNKNCTRLSWVVTVLWFVTFVMMCFRGVFQKQVIGIALGVSLFFTVVLCLWLIILCFKHVTNNISK